MPMQLIFCICQRLEAATRSAGSSDLEGRIDSTSSDGCEGESSDNVSGRSDDGAGSGGSGGRRSVPCRLGGPGSVGAGSEGIYRSGRVVAEGGGVVGEGGVGGIGGNGSVGDGSGGRSDDAERLGAPGTGHDSELSELLQRQIRTTTENNELIRQINEQLRQMNEQMRQMNGRLQHLEAQQSPGSAASQSQAAEPSTAPIQPPHPPAEPVQPPYPSPPTPQPPEIVEAVLLYVQALWGRVQLQLLGAPLPPPPPPTAACPSPPPPSGAAATASGGNGSAENEAGESAQGGAM